MQKSDWFKWSLATIIAAVTMTATGVASAYSIFQTKDRARSDKEAIVKSIDELKEEVKDLNSWLRRNQVKKSILEYLKYIPKCSVFPIPTTGIFDPRTKRFRKSPGRLGTPDILLCYNGLFIALEVKTKTGRATENQLKVIEDVRKCGGIAEIVRSIDDVKKILEGGVNGYL